MSGRGAGFRAADRRRGIVDAAMNVVAMDTLEAARGLEAAGFEREKADAVVRMVAAAVAAGREDAAAKSDFTAVKADFADLRQAFAAAVDKMARNQVLVGAALLAAMVLLSFL